MYAFSSTSTFASREYFHNVDEILKVILEMRGYSSSPWQHSIVYVKWQLIAKTIWIG